MKQKKTFIHSLREKAENVIITLKMQLKRQCHSPVLFNSIKLNPISDIKLDIIHNYLTIIYAHQI